MSRTRGASTPVEQREHPVDDDLRLRARHEGARVGLQRQVPEVPLAEDVGQRLPRLTPHEQRLGGLGLAPAQRTLGRRVELAPRHAEHVLDDPLGFAAGVLDPRRR